METRDELLAMVGTEGNEIKVKCLLDNTLYSDWEFQELLDMFNNAGKTGTAKKYQKNAKKVRISWIWTKQNSFHAMYGFCLVHSNEKIEEI